MDQKNRPSKKQNNNNTKKTTAATTGSVTQQQQQQQQQQHLERTEPRHRGIHTDAIVAGRAPTSASSCVACRNKILKHDPRWGLKYAGNPLGIPVVPLYGSHPMVMWLCCSPNHNSNNSNNNNGGCGLAYARYTDMASEAPAVRTCHACQDSPDDTTTTTTTAVDDSHSSRNNVRLLCGAPPKGPKIRRHVFHISCWIRSIQQSSSDDPSICESLLVDPSIIGTQQTTTNCSNGNSNSTLCGISWDDLSPHEQKLVRKDFETMGVVTVSSRQQEN